MAAIRRGIRGQVATERRDPQFTPPPRANPASQFRKKVCPLPPIWGMLDVLQNANKAPPVSLAVFLVPEGPGDNPMSRLAVVLVVALLARGCSRRSDFRTGIQTPNSGPGTAEEVRRRRQGRRRQIRAHQRRAGGGEGPELPPQGAGPRCRDKGSRARSFLPFRFDDRRRRRHPQPGSDHAGEDRFGEVPARAGEGRGVRSHDNDADRRHRRPLQRSPLRNFRPRRVSRAPSEAVRQSRG